MGLTLNTLLIFLTFYSSISFGQDYIKKGDKELDKVIEDRFDSQEIFKNIEIVSVYKLTDSKFYFIGWDSVGNVSGLFDTISNTKQIVYRAYSEMDETHLIRLAKYTAVKSTDCVLAVKYGYPENTEGIKFFHFLNDTLSYLGQIDYLLVDSITNFEYIAPFDKLLISYTNVELEIKYPNGNYVNGYSDNLESEELIKAISGLHFIFNENGFIIK